jgi:hypothetical protein
LGNGAFAVCCLQRYKGTNVFYISKYFLNYFQTFLITTTAQYTNVLFTQLQPLCGLLITKQYQNTCQQEKGNTAKINGQKQQAIQTVLIIGPKKTFRLKFGGGCFPNGKRGDGRQLRVPRT